MKKKLLLLTLLTLPAFGFGQVMLNETFDSGIPSTWTIQRTNLTQTWRGASATATVTYDENLEQQDEWLITPTLDFSGELQTIYLDFEAGLSYYWSVSPNNNYDLVAKISTDNGTTWTPLWSETDLGEFESFVMNPVHLDISAYIGQPNVKLAFQYVGLDGAQASIDNVRIEGFAETPQPPLCGTLVSPANGAEGVNYQPNIPLVWSAPTEGAAATEYQVRFGTNPSSLNLLGATPNTQVGITGGAPNTTYYWSIAPKNFVGPATGCDVYSFTTGPNLYLPYCGPLAFSYIEAITQVTFAGINNMTQPSSSIPHELFLDQIAEVTPGETYTMTLGGNTEGNFGNKFNVFIDWNQNGTFDENERYAPSEVLQNSTGVDGKTVTVDITVPADALPGQTRLRVKKTYGSSANSDPCNTQSSFGQAEDYTVNVGTLGLTDNTKSVINIYPNPVVDYLNISSVANAKKIKVLDLTGRTVLTQEAISKENRVNMSSLTAGTYIVTVETNEGVKSFKVVKK